MLVATRIVRLDASGGALGIGCVVEFGERLFRRRNDAESINRHLDDTMWLGRAHSIGHARQQLNLLGFALTVNALALHRHCERKAPPLAA